MSTNPQTTTIRVAVESKQRLDRLSDRWHRLRGTRPTQQDLVEKAFAYLEEHAEAFITDKSWRPWSREEIEDLLESIGVDGGPPDLSERIDEYVYGWGAETEPES